MSKLYVANDLKDDFAITIQFTNVGDRTDMCLTTNNDFAPNVTSMHQHGISLASNHTQLTMADHEALQAFCKNYLESSGYVVR